MLKSWKPTLYISKIFWMGYNSLNKYAKILKLTIARDFTLSP